MNENKQRYFEKHRDATVLRKTEIEKQQFSLGNLMTPEQGQVEYSAIEQQLMEKNAQAVSSVRLAVFSRSMLKIQQLQGAEIDGTDVTLPLSQQQLSDLSACEKRKEIRSEKKKLRQMGYKHFVNWRDDGQIIDTSVDNLKKMQQQSGRELLGNDLLLTTAIRRENEKKANELDERLRGVPQPEQLSAGRQAQLLGDIRRGEFGSFQTPEEANFVCGHCGAEQRLEVFRRLTREQLAAITSETLCLFSTEDLEQLDARQFRFLNLRTLSALSERQLETIERTARLQYNAEDRRLREARQYKSTLEIQVSVCTKQLEKNERLIAQSSAKIAEFSKTYVTEESVRRRFADNKAAQESIRQQLKTLDERKGMLAAIGKSSPDEIVSDGLEKQLGSRNMKSDEQRAHLSEEYAKLRLHFGKQLAALEKLIAAQDTDAQAIRDAEQRQKDAAQKETQDRDAGEKALEEKKQAVAAQLARAKEDLISRLQVAEEKSRPPRKCAGKTTCC